MPAGVGDGTDGFERVQVKDENLTPARNIDSAAVIVGINIVNPAGAHELGGFDNLVRTGGRLGKPA